MLLYIDGAVRTESRTRELADYLAGKFICNVEYVRLSKENILPMNLKTLSMRDESCQKEISAILILSMPSSLQRQMN